MQGIATRTLHWLMILLLAAPSLLMAANTIELQSRAEMEVVKTDEQGEESIVRVPAEKVIPGETVIYTNTYRNIGQEPATNLVINNPVPEHTDYLPGSAFGDAEIVFSADSGKTFTKEGEVTIIGDNGKQRLATPAEYTSLRWLIKNALQPGESGEVGFRVRLQ